MRKLKLVELVKLFDQFKKIDNSIIIFINKGLWRHHKNWSKIGQFNRFLLKVVPPLFNTWKIQFLDLCMKSKLNSYTFVFPNWACAKELFKTTSNKFGEQSNGKVLYRLSISLVNRAPWQPLKARKLCCFWQLLGSCFYISRYFS